MNDQRPAGPALRETRQAYFPELGGFTPCQVILRERLRPGDVVTGPAIIEERESTSLVLPGDRAELSTRGNLVISIGGLSS